MSGKMLGGLLGVAILAAGLGGAVGWTIGRGSPKPINDYNAIIEVMTEHGDFANDCQKKGAIVQVGVTSIEFDGESAGADAPVINDETVAAVIAELPKSTASIRRVALRGAEITDATLKRLADPSADDKKLDFLESLDLTNCKKITDAGLEHFYRMPTLETLTISGCDGITEAGVQKLKDYFKHQVFGRKDLRITRR